MWKLRSSTAAIRWMARGRSSSAHRTREFLGTSPAGSGVERRVGVRGARAVKRRGPQQGLDVRLYTMTGVGRGKDTARRIADRYTPLTDLFEHPTIGELARFIEARRDRAT